MKAPTLTRRDLRVLGRAAWAMATILVLLWAVEAMTEVSGGDGWVNRYWSVVALLIAAPPAWATAVLLRDAD